MSDWPKVIDVKNDITKQGVATTFLRQMIAGMHSRGLYDVVSRKPPTVQSIVSYAGNAEGVDASTAQEFLDKVLSEKAALLRLLAAQLLPLVKWDSLMQHEQDLLNRLATDGHGDEVYDWIVAAVDITKGKPQDKIRKTYEAIKVAATDNAVQLILAIEAKYWLYKQNTRYSRVDVLEFAREGVREINTMLLNAHPVVAANASTALTQIDTMNLVGEGDEYVQSLVEMMNRYGDTLLHGASGGGGGGQLTIMSRLKALEAKGGGGGGGGDPKKGEYEYKGGCGTNGCNRESAKDAGVSGDRWQGR